MELFNSQSTRNFTAQNTENLTREINNISDNDILTLDINELADYYYDNYSINIIELYKEDINSSIEEVKIEEANPFFDRYSTFEFEPRTFIVDGYRINYKIPFDGNSNLLYLQPNMRLLAKFDIDRIETKSAEYLPAICYSINLKRTELDGKENPQEIIDKKFEKEFGKYESMIRNVNNDIAHYNSSLRGIIIELLNKRKEKSSNLTSLLSKINIPLKSSPNATNTTPITLTLKKEKKKYPEKHNKTMEDYSIKEEDYNNIKNIINQSCISFEHTASTMNKLEEEEIRDFLLATLNTHYNSLATGETFSKTGKTDIRIQMENKAAYIAECKIWHGISEFRNAISQLFGYVTWRDVKTSLIVFNKNNKDFSSLLNKVDNELNSHDLCLSCKRLAPNNWQCTFKKNNESEEKIEVNVLLCDISV